MVNESMNQQSQTCSKSDADDVDSLPLVAICVATFKRPKGLAQLLESLKALKLEGLAPYLVVCDNDENKSAQSIVQDFVETMPFSVSYVVETIRGIVAVRNRLVTEARANGAEFVAFVDDDQTASPEWLQELMDAAIKYNAAAVSPNLQYAFPDETSHSIQRCFTTHSDPKPTGTPVRSAGTNGSLFRMSALDLVHGPFDFRMNLSGGSDSLLGVTLKSLGQTIISCSSAEITEHMPESRLNFRWIAIRGWREGNSRAQQIRWVTPSRGRSLRWCVLLAGYTAKNALMAIPDAIRYREVPLRRFRLTIFGVSGLWHMLFGFSSYEEYKTTHGN